MITERDGRLVVEGPMTADTAATLLQQGTKLIESANRTLDLAAVQDIDSSALALILALQRAARAAGKQLRIVNVPQTFNSLASLYDVSDILFPPARPADAVVS